MLEAIQARRSVRTYDGRPLSAEHRDRITKHLANAENPFGVPVTLRLLDARAYGLSSPVIVGEKQYLAGKVRRVENYELAFGYTFETACLYAKTLGLGTVMLAASLNRSAFEAAMQVGADEVLPCASPIGYPAEKMSLRETVMRKGVKADRRLPFETLFFRGDFEHPLRPSEAGVFAEALAMLRLAPSAVNRQPWRCVVMDDRVDFYELHSMAENRLGDVQKVDLGIALSHFDLTRQARGVEGAFVKRPPAARTDEKLEYVLSFEAKL